MRYSTIDEDAAVDGEERNGTTSDPAPTRSTVELGIDGDHGLSSTSSISSTASTSTVRTCSIALANIEPTTPSTCVVDGPEGDGSPALGHQHRRPTRRVPSPAPRCDSGPPPRPGQARHGRGPSRLRTVAESTGRTSPSAVGRRSATAHIRPRRARSDHCRSRPPRRRSGCRTPDSRWCTAVCRLRRRAGAACGDTPAADREPRARCRRGCRGRVPATRSGPVPTDLPARAREPGAAGCRSAVNRRGEVGSARSQRPGTRRPPAGGTPRSCCSAPPARRRRRGAVRRPAHAVRSARTRERGGTRRGSRGRSAAGWHAGWRRDRARSST